MFKHISLKIALQFSLYVFLFFLVNGLIFLYADFTNARRQSHHRLTENARFVMDQATEGLALLPVNLPSPLRESLRITDLRGTSLFTGEMFQNLPFTPDQNFTVIKIDDEDYTVLTMPILRYGQKVGYIQLVDVDRLQARDLPRRVLIYLVISLAVSTTTFFVGLYFAKSSLAPAEAMVERLEQFTQDASHELRTPLAALRSSLDLALKTKKYEEGIASAKQDVVHITALVERLLELARIDQFSLQPATVELSSLVQQVTEKHEALAKEKGLSITSTVESDLTTQGDSALIRQLLINLIANAIKFTPEKGTVKVKLEPHTLTVEDSGVGIAQKDVPHLFDRFFQADGSRAKGGYGLGLALVKRIADLHGWTIDVHSVMGKGTAFVVHLKTSKTSKK